MVYETQFSRTRVLIDLVNTPPELDGPQNITFSEDEGKILLTFNYLFLWF